MKTQHDNIKLSSPKFAASAICSVALLSGCTQQIPGEFLLQQQNQTFTGQTKVQINTKIDMLWVVDNSSSMDVEQAKLRSGFAAFAQKYMQPTWDIRLAVIPTDLYLAAPEFSNYRNSVLAGSANYVDPTLNANFVGSSAFPSGLSSYAVYNSGASKWEFPSSGLILADLNPSWNINSSGTVDDNYSLLSGQVFSAGIHDGPIPGFCNEYVPYFLWGATHCNWREESAIRSSDANLTTYNGQTVTTATANCLNGDSNTGSSEDINSATAKCVNTIVNNNIHSGNPIISTLGANTQTLINNFTINVTTGTAGHGSERGMQSVLQLLNDNEKTANAFFRKGSSRIIIFVSDEEDQTMTAQATPYPANYSPWTHYSCDQAGLATNNPSLNISGANGVCCTGGSCQYGAEGTSCPAKTVDSTTYTLGICPSTSAPLMAVSTVKSDLDNFFMALDGTTTPNYTVTAIVPANGTSISTLQTARDYDDNEVVSSSTAAGGNEGLIMWAVDRGDRYIQLSQMVTPGAQALDLASSDYSGVLDAIGNEITQQKGTFTLARAPTSQEQTIVEVVHVDGSITVVNTNQYSLSGNILTITDLNLILSFVSTDSIVINYQPLTSV
jgi:hypothetical protein